MPWKETSKMEEKEQFINVLLENSEPFKDTCSRFGISKKTGYKWFKRFKEEGYSGLQEQSRRVTDVLISPKPNPTFNFQLSTFNFQSCFISARLFWTGVARNYFRYGLFYHKTLWPNFRYDIFHEIIAAGNNFNFHVLLNDE